MRAEVIETADGTKIAARVFEPDSPDRGSVVTGGAMGVRQDYYTPLANWLATQGWQRQLWPRMGEGIAQLPARAA